MAPAGWELAGLGAVVLLYLIAPELGGDDKLDFVNFAGPVAMGVVLVAAAWRMVSQDSTAMWTGLFWVRISSAIYFGFGSVFDRFFDETTLRYVSSYFFVPPDLRQKANLVCAAGIFVFFLAVAIFARIVPPPQPKEIRTGDPLLLLMAVISCLVGYSVKFLLAVPYLLGAYGDVMIPSSLISVSQLSSVGLFLLTLWSTKYSRKSMALPTLLLALDLIAGLLVLAKSLVVLPLIMYLLAWLRHRVSLNRIAIAGAIVAFVYFTIVPIVTFGRQEAINRHGNFQDTTMSERVEILGLYFSDRPDDHSTSATLARFHYLPSVAAAVWLYDGGHSGDSIMNVFTVFIPRFLWPNKPIYNQGSQFSGLTNGNLDSSTWMGIFGEAYWNFGWLGLFVAMPILALGFVLLARISFDVLGGSRWLHFPVVLLSIFMGMRADGDIVGDQFAQMVICFGIYVILTIGEKFTRAYIKQEAVTTRNH